MPFKHNAARRHHIPRARYRVRNWRAYEAGLKRRGDLTLWLDEAALAGWQAPRRTTPGGQAWYSDAAIELVLMLRLVFHLGLRQAEGFAASVLRLLGQDMRVPDHTTLKVSTAAEYQASGAAPAPATAHRVREISLGRPRGLAGQRRFQLGRWRPRFGPPHPPPVAALSTGGAGSSRRSARGCGRGA